MQADPVVIKIEEYYAVDYINRFYIGRVLQSEDDDERLKMKFLHQRDAKKLDMSIDSLVQRVQDVKNSITTFLFKMENEYMTISWPTVLDNFALLSGQLNGLNRLLRSDKVPELRNFVFLPLALSPDNDAQLEKLTEARINAFSHDVVPGYLRTKPEPEADEKVQTLGNRALNMSVDVAQKQLNHLNKLTSHLLDVVGSAKEEWEKDSSKKNSQPATTSSAETNTLVAAMCFGKGFKQKKQEMSPGPQNNINVQPSTMPMQHNKPGNQKAPSTIKTQIKSAAGAHPYQRPPL